GDLRRLAEAGNVERLDDALGKLAGIGALLLGQQHGDVRLVVAEPGIGGGGDDGLCLGIDAGQRGPEPPGEHRGKGVHSGYGFLKICRISSAVWAAARDSRTERSLRNLAMAARVRRWVWNWSLGT